MFFLVGRPNCEKKMNYPDKSKINIRLTDNETSISKEKYFDDIPSCNGVNICTNGFTSESSSTNALEVHSHDNCDNTNIVFSDQSDFTYQLADINDISEKERTLRITTTRKRSAKTKTIVVPVKCTRRTKTIVVPDKCTRRTKTRNCKKRKSSRGK